MGRIGHLDKLTHFFFHTGHHLVFASVGKSFGRGVIGAVHRHDSGAHVIDPSGNELLFYVVVTVHAHAVKIHLGRFAIGARHLELPGVISGDIPSVHDGFALGGASRFSWFPVRIHPHFYSVAPGAGSSGQQLVVFVELRQLHHLLHLFSTGGVGDSASRGTHGGGGAHCR